METLLLPTNSPRVYESGYRNPVLRFFKKVDKNGPIHPIHGQCWMWTGGLFDSGYGAIWVIDRNYRAHRYSWILHFGELGEDEQVLHRCDTPACVNPAHLFVGSHDDNMKDMVAKNRHPHGETSGNSVLTPAIVRQIRKLYVWHSSEYGSFGLAKRFGVGQYAIMCVLQRKTWKHVE